MRRPGLDALPGAGRAGAGDRHAGLGALGPAGPGALRAPGRDRRRAASARLPLALGRPALAPPPARRVPQRDHDPLLDGSADAPGPRRPQRDATLALYRHADPDRLAQAGRDLDRLACPSLVPWGDRDAYLPVRFAEAYAAALPNSELQIVSGAGHWPWIDRPKTVDDVLAFVT
ncbi:MAG: hypothetical protein WD810_02810 [Solirubrobacterales bacterium]